MEEIKVNTIEEAVEPEETVVEVIETDSRSGKLKKAAIGVSLLALISGAAYGAYRLFKKKSEDVMTEAESCFDEYDEETEEDETDSEEEDEDNSEEEAETE